MAHLEISTVTEIPDPFNNNAYKYNSSEYIQQGPLNYHHNSEDDNSTIVSPTTTWGSSRRSSYSSLSSSNTTTATLRHCKSLNCNKSVLYPTKKAAYERIEYLEEQMRLHKQSNEAIIKNMLSSINGFLQERQSKAPIDNNNDDQHTDKKEYTSSNTVLVKQALISEEGQGNSTQVALDKLNKLLQLVSQQERLTKGSLKPSNYK
jgi:hypothetical protein